MNEGKGRTGQDRTGQKRLVGRYLFNRPFPLEELEIAVDHVEGDLPPARPGGGQQLHVPLVAVYGALGVELESQREILLPNLPSVHTRNSPFIHGQGGGGGIDGIGGWVRMRTW